MKNKIKIKFTEKQVISWITDLLSMDYKYQYKTLNDSLTIKITEPTNNLNRQYEILKYLLHRDALGIYNHIKDQNNED